jgi:hypothetical protein
LLLSRDNDVNHSGVLPLGKVNDNFPDKVAEHLLTTAPLFIKFG